jgi:hypothetical protein
MLIETLEFGNRRLKKRRFLRHRNKARNKNVASPEKKEEKKKRSETVKNGVVTVVGELLTVKNGVVTVVGKLLTVKIVGTAVPRDRSWITLDTTCKGKSDPCIITNIPKPLYRL